MRGLTRRRLVAAGGLAAVLPAPPAAAQAAAARRSRLILLGTAGGPTPKPNRAAPANAIVVDDAVYVIDCGNGVGRQMALARLPFRKLRSVFITHHHSDHDADYGNLLLLSWESGLTTRVDAYGPPPLAKMTRLFLEMNAADIDVRIADEGRPPLQGLIAPHEIGADGLVMRDERVRVTAARVEHPMVSAALPIASTVPTVRSSFPATRARARASCGWPRAPTSWCTRSCTCRP